MMWMQQHKDGCPLLRIVGGRASMGDVMVGSDSGLNLGGGVGC